MKKLSKIISFILCLLILALSLTSCSKREDESSQSSDASENGENQGQKGDEIYNSKLVGEEAFEIGSVCIGGGGYVTGIVEHPLDPKVKYIRTDVGGAYRWESETETWISMTDPLGTPSFNGVEAIAVDPNNVNVVYIGAGLSYPSDVLKSEDGGRTFRRTNANTMFVANDTSNKASGERLAVDPNNSNIVYVGSYKGTLQVSEDGGMTWKSAPGYSGLYGDVRAIAFDKSSKTGDRSATIYVATSSGLIRSKDGGKTFSKMEGSPAAILDIRVCDNGKAYLTANFDGIKALSGDTFVDISPAELNRGAVALAIDRKNPNRIAFSVGSAKSDGTSDSFFMPIYYSDDGGISWKELIGGCKKNGMVPWWPNHHFAASISSLSFDGANQNALWFTDWYGIWTTPNVYAQNVEWYNKEKGHEETVTFNCLPMPVGTRTFFAQADNAVLYSDDISEYPKYWTNYANMMDYCAADPNFVVFVGGVGNWDDNGNFFYTKNALSEKITIHNTGWDREKVPMNVAVSASDPNNMVVLANGYRPFYTKDMGNTWTMIESLPRSQINYWSKNILLRSDKVKGGVFYYATADGLYRSEDGGESWVLASDSVKGATELTIVPNKAGNIWLTSGKGVFYSEDFGATFKKVEGVSGSIAIGKGETDDTYTLYLMGKIGTHESGLFMSTDKGETFIRIDGGNQVFKLFAKMTGDMRQNGLIYVGTGGRGWFYIRKKAR